MKVTPTFVALPLAVAVVAAVSALFAGCGAGEESASSPTQEATASAATATAAYEEDVNQVIRGLLVSRVNPGIKDLGIRGKNYYTDSAGTKWIVFDVFPELSATHYGIAKKVPDENWELVAGIGTNATECDLPADVEDGLGFGACQPDATATALAASGEDADKAIRDFALTRFSAVVKDVRVEYRTYYTDSSGTLWLKFTVFPLPEGLTDPAYGFMVRVPGGNWVGVSGPGTALVECDLPADVQTGLGFGACSPFEQEMDQAIKDFVKSTAPADVKNMIVDRKFHDADSSGTTWLACGALLVHGSSADQVYCLMTRTPEGNWVGIAGPAASETVWCDIPADVQSGLGFNVCTPQPTPTAR